MLEIIILIVVILFAVLLAVGIIDGNRFVTVREEFTLPGLSKECRFVMISDLHNQEYGDGNDKVVDAVKKINPDFIVVAGDLITAEEDEDITPGIALLKTLAHDYRVYFGIGNHETKVKQCRDRFGNKFGVLKDGLSDQNIIFLENESVDIPEYNIRLTGLELDLVFFERFHKRKKMDENYMTNAVSYPAEGKCNILIAHNPDYFPDYAKWGADLVLAGHVHGGIMRLPLLGGVIAPSLRLFPKYDGGVFREGKSVMLIGRGLGSHTIHLRFFNPAELHDVTLKPQ